MARHRDLKHLLIILYIVTRLKRARRCGSTVGHPWSWGGAAHHQRPTRNPGLAARVALTAVAAQAPALVGAVQKDRRGVDHAASDAAAAVVAALRDPQERPPDGQATTASVVTEQTLPHPRWRSSGPVSQATAPAM